jgi:sulfur carrier protein
MLINGKEMNFKDGITIECLLKELKLDYNKVVVELDKDIILKDEYKHKKLNSNSEVEIIRFVGGG